MLSLLWEVLHMGVLVLMAGYCLHYFAYKSEIEAHDQDQYTSKYSNWKGALANPMVKKWLNFGGGYYGVIAFVKLILIELNQLIAFIKSWFEQGQFPGNFGLNTLISLFVEQFTNFAKAISWPAYYVRSFTIFECAVFVLCTYVIYECSKNLAKAKLDKKAHQTI